MPTNNIDMGYLLRLEPALAVDYLNAKGYHITWNWQEQLEEAHARAFTVAKATRAEILHTLHQATVEAIANGVSEREFIANLKPELQKLGWWGKQIVVDSQGNAQQVQLGSPHRLRTILRTNKMTAYHAARYARQMENIDEQPYWQYVAVADSRTRRSHLALHGKVYRADDPIWQSLYPPNDWGCRCRVRALSEFAVKQRGLKVDSSEGQLSENWELAGVDKATGEETHVPVTLVKTDKGVMKTGAGWNYNVGQAAVGNDVAVIRKLSQIQNRELRQEVIQAINNSEVRHKAFESWVKANINKRGASHRFITAGFVSEDIAEKVAEYSAGKKYSQRVLVMTEKSLQHANSQKHIEDNIALTTEQYTRIPQVIADKNTLVLWDKQNKNLIYVDPSRKFKIMVDSPGKLKKTKEKLDAVINAYMIKDYRDIIKSVEGGNYRIVKGSI